MNIKKKKKTKKLKRHKVLKVGNNLIYNLWKNPEVITIGIDLKRSSSSCSRGYNFHHQDNFLITPIKRG